MRGWPREDRLLVVAAVLLVALTVVVFGHTIPELLALEEVTWPG